VGHSWQSLTDLAAEILDSHVLLHAPQALLALDSPSIAHTKQEAAWSACQGVLVRGAVLYQQLELVAAALMERARKHEHVPALATRVAKYAEEHYNSTQLVCGRCMM